MSERFPAIVWIDHRDAKIFICHPGKIEPAVLHSDGSGHHMQHKANITGSGHKGVDKQFFGQVIDVLNDVGAILITGPGNAKSELKNYIAEFHKDLASRIAAVEALDHPSDSELLALARKFFKIGDPRSPSTS